MQINPDFNTGVYTIRSYRHQEVDVFSPIKELLEESINTADGERPKNYKTLNQSFIVTPRKLIENWKVENPHLLTKEHFQDLLALKPEIVIIGTGKEMHFADSDYTLPLLQAGIGVEFMTTSAACRTYNFLVSDSRDVAAAIFMIKD